MSRREISYIVDPTTEEEEDIISDSTMSVPNGEEEAGKPDKPTIIVKIGEKKLTDKATVAHDAEVQATLEAPKNAAEGAKIYYTLDDKVTLDGKNGEEYKSAVKLAPETDVEEKVTIKAVTVIPATEGDNATPAQVSDPATFEVTFSEKAYKVTLEADIDASVTAGFDAKKMAALTGDGIEVAASNNKDLLLTAAITGDDAATQEVNMVVYAEKKSDGNITWTGENGTLSEDVTEAKLQTTGTNKGKYLIPASALKKDIVVNVLPKEMPKIGFKLADGTKEGMFTVTAKKGTQAIEGWTNHDLKNAANEFIYAPTGTAVTVTISPKANCALGSVKYKSDADDAADKDAKTSKTSFVVSLGTTADPLDKDYTIIVAATESYKNAVLKEMTGDTAGEAIDPDTKTAILKRTWTVAPRKVYELSAEQGAGTPFEIKKVDVTGAPADFKYEQIEDSTAAAAEGEEESTTSTGTGRWKLTVPEEAKNSTIKIKLFDAEDATTAKDEITIKVAPVIEKDTVTVTGAKDGAVNQIVGTEKTYALTLAASVKTSKDELAVTVKDGAGYLELPSGQDAPKLEKDSKGIWQLTIKTKTLPAKEGAIKLDIVNNSSEETTKPVVTTLTVNTTKPAWNGTAVPGVKLASATDVDLNLDLTLPKGVDTQPAAGTEYYYKVKTKAINADSKYTYISDDAERYYKVTDNSSATQRQVVQMIAKHLGYGTAAKFEVTVSLEQYTTENVTGGGSGTGGGSSEENGGTTENSVASVSNTGAVPYAEEGEEGTGDEKDPSNNTDRDNEDKYAVTAPDQAKLIAVSKETKITASTKVPYYAEKITLKKEKAASGLYTGQEAAVATIDFGKSATYIEDEFVDVEVLNAAGERVDEIASAQDEEGSASPTLTAEVENSKVILTADRKLPAGKYTVRVTQNPGTGIPEGVVPATASMQVTVVPGIDKIEAPEALEIYVESGKAGTTKITPVLKANDDGKPKTAKVTYSWGVLNNAKNDIEADAKVTEWVSVKNGTVTVKKGYQANDITNNTFAVKISPADYTENSAAAIVNFTINTDKHTLGEIVLVKASTSEGNATYQLISTEQAVPKNELETAEVHILKADANKDSLAATDFEKADDYTLSINKKEVSVDKASKVTFNGKKIVKGVKISATATDGSKAKATDLTFDIGYEDAAESVLELTVNDKKVTFDAQKTATLSGTPTGAILHVEAVDKSGSTLNNRLVDRKIVVKDATIVNNADKNNLSLDIVLKKETATVTLCSLDGKTVKDEYKITNPLLAAGALTAAPKVSLAKGTKLYANYGKQSLVFSVPKWNTGDKKVTGVKLSAAADSASKELLSAIENNSNMIDYTPEKGYATTFTVTIDTSSVGVKKGTLYLDFYGEKTTPAEGVKEGEEEEGGETTGTTTEELLFKTSNGVAVKTDLFKKSFKLNTKYTMSQKDTAQVALTGKGVGVKSNDGITDVTILNANIKGTPNKFKEAFEYENGNLKLKSLDYARKDYDDKETGKKMNNLIGFVRYTVNYEDGSKDTFTTQLNITIKDTVRKLSATKASVIAEDELTTTTTVVAGKTPVGLVYAAYTDNDSTPTFVLNESESYADGVVTLKLADGVKGSELSGKKTGTLTVVPADSMAAKEVAEKVEVLAKANDGGKTAAQDELDKALKGNTIDLPVTIDIKAINTAKKVKIESKDLKVTFTASDANTGKTSYVKEVPYTFTVSAKLAGVSVAKDKNDKDLAPEWISFSEEAGKLIVTIDKNAYALAVRKSEDARNKGIFKDNGKAVKATVQFNFKNGTKADTITLTVTPPLLTEKEVGEAQEPVATKVEIAKPTETSVAKGVSVECEATVTGTNLTTARTKEVTWEIVLGDGEAKKDGTKFVGNTLHIAEDEELSKIKIKATAVVKDADGKDVSAEKEITITDPSSESEEETES